MTNAVKAGGACMTCHHAPGGLQDMLDEQWGRAETVLVQLPTMPEPCETESDSESDLSPYQFSKSVENIIDEYVRPMLKKDGGDIEIVDIKKQLVYVQLSGACSGCINSTTTLKMMVEQTLKNRVDERIRVIAV